MVYEDLPNGKGGTDPMINSLVELNKVSKIYAVEKVLFYS